MAKLALGIEEKHRSEEAESGVIEESAHQWRSGVS